MGNYRNKKIVYSINVTDIQEVAQEVLDRKLNKEEIIKIKESIGDYLDWFQAIENSIHKHITTHGHT
jgi:predicted transcriptional regulator